MIYGHEAVVRQIASTHPKVSLLLGPKSVGKWTTAEHLREAWEVDDGDVMRVSKLTTEAAQNLVHFAVTAPATGKRLAIIRLDSPSRSAVTILLKTLEDQNGECRFILLSETHPGATITSRAVTFHFGLLSDEDVARVLVARKFQPEQAEHLASIAGGQISRALSVLNDSELRKPVLQVLRGFHDNDPAHLEKASKAWTDEHTNLLAAWCQESLTGRWRLFDPSEVDIQGRRIPLHILMALRADVRPKLLVRSTLMAALRGAA